jgi:hypothetical protein
MFIDISTATKLLKKNWRHGITGFRLAATRQRTISDKEHPLVGGWL